MSASNDEPTIGITATTTPDESEDHKENLTEEIDVTPTTSSSSGLFGSKKKKTKQKSKKEKRKSLSEEIQLPENTNVGKIDLPPDGEFEGEDFLKYLGGFIINNYKS